MSAALLARLRRFSADRRGGRRAWAPIGADGEAALDGPRRTAFEGAGLSARQLMGVAALPGRREPEQRTPRARGKAVELPAFAPGVAAKLAYAKGAQPAFFKIISGASGAGRARVLFEYLGTREDEAGRRQDVEIETQDGRVAGSSAARDALVEEWSGLFADQSQKRDVVRFSFDVRSSGRFGRDAAWSLVEEGFGPAAFGAARGFVFAVEDRGEGTTRVTVAFGVEKAAKGRLPEAELAAIAARLAVGATRREINLDFQGREGSGHAFSGIRHQLDRFARGDFGEAFDRRGATFTPDAVRAEAADWTRATGRRPSHDVIHTVFSARPGTDREALRRAVLATLDEEFGGFRFAVAGHADTRHVHIHAVIQTRSRAGDRLRVSKDDLDRIRETFAARAREQGVAMVNLSRDDLATTRGYSKEDKAAVRAGMAGRAAAERVRAKQTHAAEPATPPEQARRRAQAAAEWSTVLGELLKERVEDLAAIKRAAQALRRHAAGAAPEMGKARGSSPVKDAADVAERHVAQREAAAARQAQTPKPEAAVSPPAPSAAKPDPAKARDDALHAARGDLDRAERDGASNDEINRLRAAYGRLLRPKSADRDSDLER